MNHDINSIHDLKQDGVLSILALDVTSPPVLLQEIAANAIGIYERVDYLINNAG